MTGYEKIKQEFDLSLLAKNKKGLDALEKAFKELSGNLFSKVYPVGSIYMSTSSTSPKNLFGGTWARIEGAFLLAASDSTESYKGGKTGGSPTHKHTTAGHTLTVEQLPSHSHTTTVKLKMASSNNTGNLTTAQAAVGRLSGGGTGESIYTTANPLTVTNGARGGSAAHSHGDTGTASSMPPFVAVYVWKRTA